jgi:hypothetical protein
VPAIKPATTTAWGALMRSRPSMSRAVRQRGILGNRLIALSVLLCLCLLITVSGPHLVHHLDDQPAGPPHQPTHTSLPRECLVLSLMQHTPLAGDFFASPLVFISSSEQASCALWTQGVTTPRPAFQARSPPGIFRS